MSSNYAEHDNGQRLIDKFFEIYESNGPERAIKYAFGTNRWMDANTQDVDHVIVELIQSVDVIGNYIDFEEIHSRNVGSRFRMASYLVYYDRQPLRFAFQLYRNNDGWILWKFKFDTRYDEEIEQSLSLSGR